MRMVRTVWEHWDRGSKNIRFEAVESAGSCHFLTPLSSHQSLLENAGNKLKQTLEITGKLNLVLDVENTGTQSKPISGMLARENLQSSAKISLQGHQNVATQRTRQIDEVYLCRVLTYNNGKSSILYMLGFVAWYNNLAPPQYKSIWYMSVVI